MLPGQAAAPKENDSGASPKDGSEIAGDDPAYFNAIPGVRQVFTEEALLDLWVLLKGFPNLRYDVQHLSVLPRRHIDHGEQVP